ncbi:MAG: C25 family peptidase propeptide domain-containing protein [bacterium]
MSIPGHEYSFTQEVGKPKLPVIQLMLAMPDGVEISISSTSPSSIHPFTHSPILIFPVPKQVVKTTPEGYKYVAEEFFIDERSFTSRTPGILMKN